MKLHLPNGLRKALLACLAALALPVALPTTLATASGIAAAWVMASQQAKAEDVTITSKDEYNTALAEKNAQGNKWIFNIAGGNFNFGVNGNQSPTHNAAFEFAQTLTVNNGFNNATNTFNGNFTGAAGANLVFRSWGGGVTNTWRFNGDLSGFAGDILTTAAGTLNIEFSARAHTNAGAIRQDGGTLNLTINEGAVVHNSAISVNNLALNGALEINGAISANNLTLNGAASVNNVTVTGTATFDGRASVTFGSNARAELGRTTTFGDGTTLTLGRDAQLTLHEIAADSGRLTALALNAGAVLTVERSALKVKDMEIVSGTATIVVGSDAVSLDLSGEMTGDGKLVIDITGLGLESGDSFQLFTGARIDWTSLGRRVSFDGFDDENLKVDMGEDGKITLRSAKSAFLYDGGRDLAWGIGGDGGWVGGQEWDNSSGRDVNFTATEGTHLVSLAVEELKVGVMDVAAGAAVYNFSNGSVSNNATLNVSTLTVGEGVTMNFAVGAQLRIGSYLSLGKDAVLAISGNMEFDRRAFFRGESGSKIVCAEGVTDPVYLGLYLGGETRETIDEYLKDVLHGITTENVGIRKRGSDTLAFTHNLELGYTAGPDTFDVPLEIAEGAVRLNGSTFILNKQVTGAGKLIIATESDDEEVMVHLVGGANMTGTLEFSNQGARLGLGADSIVGGLDSWERTEQGRMRVIVGEQEDVNVKLTIDVADGKDARMRDADISGVDIVKRGGGTQQLAMRFRGGSITVESGTLSTHGEGAQMSTLDATSVSISEGATFYWTDSARSDMPGYVSGEVDIQGIFQIDDIIYLAQGATIGESGRIDTAWGHIIYLGNDLIIGHAGEVLNGNATLMKGELEGAAEHVHLQLSGSNQDYGIKDGVWGSGDIKVDSSLGLYWKANSGQLKVEGSELDEVLVAGSGKLRFGSNVTLNGELKIAEDYVGVADVYVRNTAENRLVLKGGGTLGSVLNGGVGEGKDEGTYIDIGADLEVGGLQNKDADLGNVDDTDSQFEIAMYIDAPEESVSLILNVVNDVTLSSMLTLGEGVNLEKTGLRTQTIVGKVEVEGDVMVRTGVLALGGVDSKIHGALSGEGTLRVDAGGSLTLDGGGEFIGTLELGTDDTGTSGASVDAAITVVGRDSQTGIGEDLSVSTLSGQGSVTVRSGTLSLGTAEGVILTGLRLGQVAVSGTPGAPANLTVNTGSFTISGAWTWTEGSVLRLVTAGQTITLGDITEITDPERDEEGNVVGGQLTIDLTEEFLGGSRGSGRVQLFASGFKGEWTDHFRFTINGEEVDDGDYRGLELNSKGVLRWGAEDVYWIVDQAGEVLTWSDGVLFDTEEEGYGEQVEWTDDTNVSFVVTNDGAGEHDVILQESIQTGNFSISTDGTAKFNIGTPDSEKDPSRKEARTLTVNGDLDITRAQLSLSKEVQLVVEGDVALTDGGTLTLNSDMRFAGDLTGDAGSVVKGAGNGGGMVYALWDSGSTDSTTWEAFSGRYAAGVRSGDVGYGIYMSEKDLTITGAKPVGEFKVDGVGKTLTFSEAPVLDNAKVTVAGGATLALEGGIAGGGSITGTGTLKITGVEGETEPPSEEPPVFTGSISVKELIIEGGAQAFGKGDDGKGVVQGTIKVTGGVLQLNEGANLSSAAVVLAPENTAEAAELLRVVGSAEVSTLFGTGKVTVNEGATLTLSGAAGKEEVFTGQITGATAVTGTWQLGSGASLEHLTVEASGTVNVQDGEATVQQLDGSGTLAGAGTLKLTAGGSAFAGRVSSRFIYDGGSTFELSGAIDSPDVRVESGTLKVSGEVASAGGAIPAMTLAGGTLDAARNGLTIRKLILVGATSGLKVTNNLTVGEVTGDGVLGTSVIGTNASLTVRTGNLTIGVLNGDGSARGSLDIGSGAELTMQSGTLTLNGLLTWGKGAELSLGGDHERNRLVFGTDAPFGRRDGKLTVFLEERYLRGMKKSEDSFFDLDVSKWKAGWVNEMEVTTDSKRYTELKLNEDGTLTWTRYGVQWNAGASGTWSDDPSDPSDPSEGWTKVDSNEPSGEAPKDQDVYFIEEGETTVQVEIADAKDAAPGSGVHPKNVYVESGNFEFTGGGISTDGILAVGGDPKGKTRLTLSNVNISLPVIELQENGYLVLNNDRALTSPSEENGGAADTKIRFTGGTLEFGELLKDPDVSSHVATAEDGSTEAAKVNVGKDKEVRWGSAETEVTGNGGLTLILDQTGLEKGGEGNFILAWKETEEGAPHAHVGNMVVQGGTLTLRAEDGVSELRGTAEVENGTLTLQSADTAGLTYAGNITGAGTLNVSQGNVTLSGENTVADIELTGGNTTLGSDSALGNADTVLTLTGGSVTGVTGSTSTVNAGTVSVVGAPTVNGAVTFSGTVIGEGTLRAGTGAAVTLTGSLSRKDETGEVTQQFLGTLDTGAGTITLNNSDTEVRASVAGNGTLEVKPAVDPSTGKPADVTLAGTLGASDGNLTVKNGGESDLLITSQNCGGGLNLSFNEPVEGDDPAVGGDTPEESEPRIPRIVLGDAEHAVNVAELRSVTGAGDVVLSNVTLDMASDFRKETARMFVDTAVPAQNASDVRAVDAAPAGGEVFLGGRMDAANLDGITVNAHGLLSGVSGTYQVSPDKQLTLYFSADNMGREEERGKLQGLINGNDDFNIAFSAGDAKTQGFNLEFDRSALLAALRAGGENNALYLRALQGGKWNAAEVGVTLSAQDELADILGARYEFTDDGLMIWGSTKDLYIVMDGDESDPAVSRDPDVLGRRLATVVTAGQTLTLDWGKDGTVHNLLGGDNATLNINDTSGSGLTVTLDNTYHEDIRDGRDQYTEAARGQDTTFEGTITGGKGVDIVKTGLGTLTVNGNYTLEDGDTRIEAGALHLCGDNSMRSLTFAYGEPSTESRGLTLETGHTSIGSIAEATTTEGNAVKLTKNAELTLTGGGTLARTSVTGDGSGKLRLKDNASLVFTGGGITDTKVELGSGTVLDLGASQSQLTALDGSGTLKSAEGGVVTVGGGKFSGTLGSSAEGGKVGGLVVADGALFTLDNAKSESGVKMNVQVGKEASLTVDVSGKTGSASDTLVLGDISIGDGGSLTLDFGGKDISRDFVQGNITSVGTDGSIVFNRDDELKSGVYYTGLTVADVTMKDYVQFTGFGNFLKDITSDVQDGELVLRVTDARQNKFTEPLRHVAQGSEKNAQAGSVILWNAFLAHPDVGNKPGSDLAALASTLVNSVNAGKSAGLARTLTAAAGAAISTLGPALAEDMHRQLTAIRNRTTTMANEVRNGADGQYPLRHAWINAESGYHELDSDGLAPGYKLTGWGGTVGADVDISRHLTAGLAFTAMYGDLDADAADSATGDMDTYYLSAFARVASGSWIHSFVLSGGVADVELNRTVNYGGLSPYRTNGSTDGYALGALYEVGYTGFVNRQGTAALQPIFNVEVRHVAIKGYSESGSDAGVDADDIDQTVLTFGAGARAQFAVGANVFNRAAVLETRALLKADVGDRSGTVSNAIVGNTARAEVESAEVGAVGVEAGVGISVPLGSNAGSVFLDGSLEFREGWTSANASLGYRINF